jgi:hypothetical protein
MLSTMCRSGDPWGSGVSPPVLGLLMSGSTDASVKFFREIKRILFSGCDPPRLAAPAATSAPTFDQVVRCSRRPNISKWSPRLRESAVVVDKAPTTPSYGSAGGLLEERDGGACILGVPPGLEVGLAPGSSAKFCPAAPWTWLDGHVADRRTPRRNRILVGRQTGCGRADIPNLRNGVCDHRGCVSGRGGRAPSAAGWAGVRLDRRLAEDLVAEVDARCWAGSVAAREPPTWPGAVGGGGWWNGPTPRSVGGEEMVLGAGQRTDCHGRRPGGRPVGRMRLVLPWHQYGQRAGSFTRSRLSDRPTTGASERHLRGRLAPHDRGSIGVTTMSAILRPPPAPGAQRKTPVEPQRYDTDFTSRQGLQ